ncbi:hypothetical protein [Paenibacillus sp. CMAA1364]
MRRIQKSVIAVVALSVLLLVGCNDDMGNKVSDWSKELTKDGIHKEISRTEGVGSATELILKNEVGSIEVTATTGDQMKVIATLLFPNKPSHESKYDEIISQTEISVITQGDQIKVSAHPKGKEKMEMWKWVKEEYGLIKFTINYKVELPETVDHFNIGSNVGEIKLHNLTGTYDIHNDVGTIDIDGAHIVGKSTITSNVGSVVVGIQQMDSKSTLSAKTDVGSIKAILAEQLKCTIEAKSDVGQVVGAPKGKSERNGGGPLLSLTSSVGAVTVENP